MDLCELFGMFCDGGWGSFGGFPHTITAVAQTQQETARQIELAAHKRSRLTPVKAAVQRNFPRVCTYLSERRDGLVGQVTLL